MSWNPITVVKTLLTQKYVGALVRALMQILSGYLINLGLAPDAVEKFISSGTDVLIGVIMALASLVWSWMDKKTNQPPSAPVIVDGGSTSPR